jgi:hypothetical protein
VGRNKKLGFSIGRDFNQNYYYDAGDLILGLDLLLGFGTRKAL